MVSNADLRHLETLVQPLIGQRVSEVHAPQFGISFWLSFSPAPDDPDAAQEAGAWILWIEHGQWRLERKGRATLGCEDPDSVSRDRLRSLEGTVLQSIRLTSPAADAVLTFDNELVLRVFCARSTEFIIWDLFMPNDEVLIVGPGGFWSYGVRGRDK